jgi:hypothetical protein
MMRVSRLLGFIGLLAVLAGRNVYADMAAACSDQAMIAEHSASIPEGLLLAIGKQESGRFDPQTGSAQPWPWSVNRDGQSAVFGTQAEAVTYVADAQRAGRRSIDVGCFQINLKYHPGAFASLQDAFDPAANAAYAARFLRELYDRDGSWEAAVADYHSATPWFGEPYRDAVLAIWHGVSQPAALAGGFDLSAPRTVMGIHIFGPAVQRIADKGSIARTGETTVFAYRRGRTIPMIPPRLVNGLPVVITPDTVIAAR